MSLPRSFKFFHYELREATPADLPLATEWTAADPAHAGQIDPAFWIQDEPMDKDAGAERYVLVDPQGAIFFVRLEKAIRLYIQFGPNDTPVQRIRNLDAMEQGMRWLAVMLGIRAVREILFDSQAERLRLFCRKRLGFAEKKDTLTRRLARYTPAVSTKAEVPSDAGENPRQAS